jgi:transcriptional regulator with XRE-family HTH domain
VNAGQAGRSLRAIRHRQRKRLIDVAGSAGLSKSTISRAERGTWSGLTVGSLDAIAAALGARLTIVVSWNGAELDRMIDEGHARITATVIEHLKRLGWETKVEVSFSVYGERGSIDVLAWHAPSATLLVVEVKTELGSVEGLLRPLDIKVRLAAQIAREQFGWAAARVSAVVVFPESDAVRRQFQQHAVVLDAALPIGSREVRAWLRQPVGSIRGRWFTSISRGQSATRNPSAIRRVRRPKATQTAP